MRITFPNLCMDGIILLYPRYCAYTMAYLVKSNLQSSHLLLRGTCYVLLVAHQKIGIYYGATTQLLVGIS
jgi:hypothetical protein